MTMNRAEARRTIESLNAVGSPVERVVRPLAERLRTYCADEQLCAEYADAMADAAAQLERWEAYRAELVDMEQRLGKIAGNFLVLGAWEDAAKCALKAEGMRWVRGRMPPAA